MSFSKPLFPPQPTSERVREYARRAQALRIPSHGSIELTHRCNLACVHCYVNLPAADREASRRELTTEEIETLLDELAAEGLLTLTLTGGEPLVRPDFPRIYRYAHEKGILVTVYSNATLITDAIVQLFRDCPPVTVDSTMYGYTPET
jgi:MoaA/NifB/PqqE/SkfB family radical SAM enzyme